MKYFLEALAVLVLFVIQTMSADFFAIKGVKPDFLFLFLCLRAYINGPIHGSVLGFLIGLLQDIYSPGQLGATSLAKTIVGFGVGRTREFVYPGDVAMRLLAIFIAFVCHDLVFFLASEPSGLLHGFVRITLFSAVYTTAIAGCISLLVYGVGKLLPS